MRWVRCAVLALAVGLGLGTWGAEVPSTAPATTTAPQQKMRVKTAQELIKALGSDRILELEPGEYRLDETKRGAGKSFKWDLAADDEFELVIRNCHNLTLKGVGSEPAHLLTGFAYANVLVFRKCENVELLNLKLGHAPDVGECIGGVVKAEECENVTVRKCDLYGCGIEGLTLNDVNHLRFTDSVIHDCSQGVVTADDCDDLAFDASRFEQIKEFHGFDFGSCTHIAFTDCIVEHVELTDEKAPLFRTNLSDEDCAITFKGGQIKNNRCATLINAQDMLKTTDTKMSGNSWE